MKRLALATALAAGATASSAAAQPATVPCWPEAVPLVAGVIDPPPPGTICAFPSRELAEVSSWRLSAAPGRVLADLRRELASSGWRVGRTTRTRESAGDHGLSIRAERGSASSPSQMIVLIVRPETGGTTLVVYDWSRR
jgi:hypothetical protein